MNAVKRADAKLPPLGVKNVEKGTEESTEATNTFQDSKTVEGTNKSQEAEPAETTNRSLDSEPVETTKLYKESELVETKNMLKEFARDETMAKCQETEPIEAKKSQESDVEATKKTIEVEPAEDTEKSKK